MRNVDESAIGKFPYSVVRDYFVFPLSVEPAQITLAVPADMPEEDKEALQFILHAPVHYTVLQRDEMDALRRRYFGIGARCTKCPYCGASEVAEIIWDLALDDDPRLGDPRYELAETYRDGRGHRDQLTEDPRWICRICGRTIGWKDVT